MKTAKKRKVKIRFKLIILAFLLVYVGIAVYSQQSNINELAAQKETLTRQYEQAQNDLNRLEHQDEYMSTDNYIENTAREKFGLAYGDEIILKPKQ